MINLDSLDNIKKIDSKKLVFSIRSFPDQIKQAWREVFEQDIPQSCPLAKNVVVSGMGGSALGGRIVDSLLLDRFRTPIEVVTEYNLPNYVNRDTLVILTSYSGNTEETLSAAREAQNRGAILFAITTGGKLAEFIKSGGISGYVFDPVANPSGQPRMGLGYSITATLAVLARCEFINLLDSEMADVLEDTKKLVSEFDIATPESVNLAKRMAIKLKGKIPLIIASEHLVGSAHAFKNQLNENAKTFSALFEIPELNHHLMEGLKNPYQIKELLHFLFLESDLYTKEVQKRYPITREVIEKNSIETSSYFTKGKRKLNQIFEVITFSSFLAYYLAMLYDEDPTPIPWVDFFKENLAKT